MNQGYILESWNVNPHAFGSSGLGPDLHKPIGDRGNFEVYLSYLSQDQPWLTEAENHRNRSEFLTYSGAIAGVLLEAQNRAMQATLPTWLQDILVKWHQTRSVVITFNYDCLLEKAASGVLTDGNGNQLYYADLYPVPITSILLRRAAVLADEPQETLRLLKLHGSVNWYYSGSNTFYGEQIYDIGLQAGWGPNNVDSMTDLQAKAPDKIPLIVPPTATKSTYFNNETIRSQWILARRAIESAENLYCIGYSFPETDVMVRSLVSWSAKRGIRCYPVNPDPSVVDRLKDIFDEEQLDDAYVGSSNATELFASSYPAPSTS
jgi:hypothetical protein